MEGEDNIKNVLKEVGWMWTGFIWIRTVTGGVLLRTWYEVSDAINDKISWLLDSKEEFALEKYLREIN